ncbi:MAG: citrate synthase [Myxococcales bacterium]|nr:citrate synthase [Myxococcales bacterium]
MEDDLPIDRGLEGVVVADSTISGVDGEGGRLIIRGHDIESLAREASVEGLCGLLWEGDDPDPDRHRRYQRQLAEARQRAFEGLEPMAPGLEPMAALRARLAGFQTRAQAPLEQAAELTGACAVFAAADSRQRRGLEPIAPDTELNHAGDYLRMITGEHGPVAARVLGRYLVTVVDHGMNASTFTARVITSTDSDMVSAVVGAVGALKGPLHGGAPGPVLDMLDAVAREGDAERFLQRELSAGRRIMGMGHRVYRVRDPRAAVLEEAIQLLSPLRAGAPDGQPQAQGARLAVARRVEAAAAALLRKQKPTRKLAANVEFYTAVLLDALGIDRLDFSPTFAVGRVVGWCAHILEQRQSGRLIRPRLRYVGPRPEIAA